MANCVVLEELLKLLQHGGESSNLLEELFNVSGGIPKPMGISLGNYCGLKGQVDEIVDVNSK